MHVRCPHCRNPIELVDSSTLHNVECPSCGSNFSLVDDETKSSFPSETKTIGHFDLIEQLGIGAFGSVWKSHDTKLDRTVAIKIPRKAELSSMEAEQFLREARAAAQLKHPNIVSVHEVGREIDQLYIVSDFVQGATLAEWIESQILSPREAAELCSKLAVALHHAHEAGVIHRDLKPSNIMIGVDGEPRIMDFGLAKREAGEITMTVEGKILGTPAYMPPEQARGEGHNADARSDVYALGVILFQLLTGDIPFRGNPRMLILQILRDDPPSPRRLNGSVTRDLETICLKCLQKDPAKRFESARALADDLDRTLRGEPIHARASSKVEKTFRWCQREPAKAIALALMFVLSIGGPWSAIRQAFLSRQNAVSRADALLNANPAAIHFFLNDIDRSIDLVEPRLRELSSGDLTKSQRLRLSLALLPSDPRELKYLMARMNDCSYEELGVVLTRIKSTRDDQTTHEFWSAFHDELALPSVRLRAGIALAVLDAESELWVEKDYQFLATSVLNENTVYQPAIRQSIQSLSGKLVSHVKQAFSDQNAGETVRESAANAILDFAGRDFNLLTSLSMVATPKQHAILFPHVELHAETDETIVRTFVDVTKLQPVDTDDEATRIMLGKRRAGAAINLLRMNQPDASLEVFRVRDDPESVTQFVHGARVRGVSGIQLVELLERANSKTERCGILLALGEFPQSEIPRGVQDTLVDELKTAYKDDPNSGIHASSGWLLRKWGHGEEADAIEKRSVPYSPNRQWFTRRILLPPHDVPTYLTFVVFSAGKYWIGSPKHEQNRYSDEQLREVHITRAFAVLDREITRQEYMAVTGFRGFSNEKPWQPDPASAMSGTTWYMAVSFCRSLTSIVGISEEGQAYVDPNSLDRLKFPLDPEARIGKAPKNWPVEISRSGFRLPTSAEWEISCRGGVSTTYGFGSDSLMLDHYAWHLKNSGNRGHTPQESRCNYRGLFDTHGNMFEWCHDWAGGNVAEQLDDPKGPHVGSLRVLRGGGWSFNPSLCRSAYRSNNLPTHIDDNNGFRIVFTLGGLSGHDQ